MAVIEVIQVCIPVTRRDATVVARRLLAAYPEAAIHDVIGDIDAQFLRVGILNFETFCRLNYRERPDLIDFMIEIRRLMNELLHNKFENKIDLSISPGTYGWSVRDIVMVATPEAVRTDDIIKSFEVDVIEAFEAWRQQLLRQVTALDALVSQPPTVS